MFVGEGISIAGTITYDDVTNIDSVGIVTAGKGFRATTGGVIVTAGVGTFKGDVELHGNQGVASITFDSSANSLLFKDSSYAKFGTGGDLEIYYDGTDSYVKSGNGDLWIDTDGDDLYLQAQDDILIRPQNGQNGIEVIGQGAVNLYHNDVKKLETISPGASVYGGLRLEGGGLMREHFNTSGTALNSGKDINCSSGMVHYRSAAVGAANVKLNVVSTAGINTDMAIGDAMTLTVITVAGNTAHFVDQIRVDGVEASAGVTTHWVGGSAPTEGGGSGVDTYAFNILKTGNAAYLVVGNHVKTS